MSAQRTWRSRLLAIATAQFSCCPRGARSPNQGPSPQRMPSRRTVSIGGGVRVPYPEPTTEAASKIGRGNRRSGTKVEMALRSELHKRGLRFRKDFRLDAPGVRVRPDVVFTRARVSIFIDGCFWHCCPEHMNMPKSNPDYLEIGRAHV